MRELTLKEMELIIGGQSSSGSDAYYPDWSSEWCDDYNVCHWVSSEPVAWSLNGSDYTYEDTGAAFDDVDMNHDGQPDSYTFAPICC